MNLIEFTTNNALALSLGAFIGLERQWRQRNAGLRRNAFVSLGAALFVSFSMLVTGVLDQTRMAAQVVTGIGFLGAGIMMRESLNIRGLNTAETLWSAGAIGTLAGAGLCHFCNYWHCFGCCNSFSFETFGFIFKSLAKQARIQ
jgi:putative Mg2+ transporter-C (MgtC) family protein